MCVYNKPLTLKCQTSRSTDQDVGNTKKDAYIGESDFGFGLEFQTEGKAWDGLRILREIVVVICGVKTRMDA